MGCNASSSVSLTPEEQQKHRREAWTRCRPLFPCRRAADADARDELFTSLDKDDTGSITLSRMVEGVEELLQMRRLYDPAKLLTIMQNGLLFSKKAARRRSSLTKPAHPPDERVVTRVEFRLYLSYVYEYTELWIRTLDQFPFLGENAVLSEREFSAIVGDLKDNGVRAANPIDVFRREAAQQGGVMTFDQVVHWAIAEGLDFGDKGNH